MLADGRLRLRAFRQNGYEDIDGAIVRTGTGPGVTSATTRTSRSCSAKVSARGEGRSASATASRRKGGQAKLSKDSVNSTRQRRGRRSSRAVDTMSRIMHDK
ncbi:MAG: hypothetical protein WKG07_29720 [Hymenobacter sp.]